jgi:hypothetical protein
MSGAMKTMRKAPLDRKFSARLATFGMLLFVSVGQVKADAPAIGIWVDLKVSQCRKKTFGAPLHKPNEYIPGDKYRTGFVIGRVVSAGLQPYDSSQEWVRQLAEESTKQLPARNEQLSLVLRQWDASLCQSAIGRVARFNFVYLCDSLPHRGECLPPYQLVQPAAR